MKSIVVVDRQWGIGKDNDLLFRLPLDLGVNFKQKTLGKVVVMGANTFYSLPKSKPLSDRVNIVLDSSGMVHDGTITVGSVESLLEVLSQYDENNIFIIGGASVYALMLEHCDTVYVTKVDAEGGANVFFPNLDNMSEWDCANTSDIIVDNNYSTTYNVYTRINRI